MLCIDSTRAYSNFMFSAANPETGRWTIWRKSIVTGKYSPVFNDKYNRLHVKVSADKKEMIYVRYRTPKENAMRNAALDTAWICRGATNGNHEQVLFSVPQFNKNAIYDLDWTVDKQRILFAVGNDQFPTITRDGDIFEYNVTTNTIVNRTNNWELWSNHCTYSPDGKEIAYSHYANFTTALPTDIFIQHADGNSQQITHTQQHINTYPFCTLTDFTGDKVIYRRGQYYDNSLFEKGTGTEQQIFKVQGFGGIHLNNQLYAATDLENSIYIFTRTATVGSIRIASIKDFAVDNSYNYDNNLNTRLNWLGKQKVKVMWSTGDTTLTINVHPTTNTTYYCTVTDNGKAYRDTIKVRVATSEKPIITKKCFSLTTTHYTSYQWLLNGKTITGATDSSYTPEAGGNYAVTVINADGGLLTSMDTYVSAVEADSVNAINNKVQLLPDPNTSVVKIEAPFMVNMAVINAQGKIVDQKKDAREIDMSSLPGGSYTILLYDNNCLKLKTRKMIMRR